MTYITYERIDKQAAVNSSTSIFQLGDVRYNLDPFQERSDEEIWSALEKCHIRETVSY